jgi:hypothetical protein
MRHVMATRQSQNNLSSTLVRTPHTASFALGSFFNPTTTTATPVINPTTLVTHRYLRLMFTLSQIL